MNFNQDIIKIGAGVLSGALVGSGVTYILVKKRITAKAEARADEEIKSVKDTYRLLRKEPPYDDPVTAAAAYLDRKDELDEEATLSVLAAQYQAHEEAEVAVAEAEEVDEVAADALRTLNHSNVDVDELTKTRPIETQQASYHIFEQAESRLVEGTRPIGPDVKRTHAYPYLITTDEFLDDENPGYSKITIAYWDGDQTLCDDQEKPIPNDVVGEENLKRFGEGSDSPDTIYVRNERLQTDFEVNREEGKYSHIVLGLDTSREERRPLRKMRDDV